ncbi:MAG: phosphoserine phosphatase, partial [Candidatus Thermoplasmatota archaeon]|nr:phosphoserine phosphatase [Candidatus Thermoplasmatota archaeon]
MAELIGELEDKRARHNADAEKHKRVRDELNDKTKEWAERRDELNSQVRKLIDEANIKRESRDKLNSEVREAKAQRDEWNRKFNDLSDKAINLRREKMPKSGLSIRKFKAELRALEKKHMTSVLSADKEKALMKEMSQLDAKIKEMEMEIEQFSEVKTAEKETRDAKDNAENFHKKVSESAEKAQIEHDAM